MSMTMEERRVCDVRIFAIFHQKGANCLVARINGQSRESRRWHHYWVSRCSRSREELRESEFWNWKIFGEIGKMSLLWCYVSYPHFGVDKSLSSLILLSKSHKLHRHDDDVDIVVQLEQRNNFVTLSCNFEHENDNSSRHCLTFFGTSNI